MKESLGIPKDVQEVVEETQSQVLARLTIAGVKNDEAAKQLGVSQYKIRQLQKSEEFKKHLRDAAEEMSSNASNVWKAQMSELLPLAYETLKQALKKGDLRGVEIIVKTLGFDKQVQAQSNGNIQIILPEFKQEKNVDIEVEK